MPLLTVLNCLIFAFIFQSHFDQTSKLLLLLLLLLLFFFQIEEHIEDCDKAVELGRQLQSDSKMIATSFTGKQLGWQRVVQNLLNDEEPVIETLQKALPEHHYLDTFKKLNDAEKVQRELKQKEYIDTNLANEEHEKGIPF